MGQRRTFRRYASFSDLASLPDYHNSQASQTLNSHQASYHIRVTTQRVLPNCCSVIALNAGDRADCATMARQTITMLEQALAESKADYIVGATTSCVVTLTQDYLRLFEDLQQQGWLWRAQALAEKVMDFASFSTPSPKRQRT
jgi:Fe-S oxidoreductase